MGGDVTLVIKGTAYGDPREMYDAWQKALVDKAGLWCEWANDTYDTVIDNRHILIRRGFLVRPDQVQVILPEPEPGPEPNPSPTVRTMRVVASAGVKLRAKPGLSAARVGGLAVNTLLGIDWADQPVDGYLWCEVVTVGGLPYAGEAWVARQSVDGKTVLLADEIRPPL